MTSCGRRRPTRPDLGGNGADRRHMEGLRYPRTDGRVMRRGTDHAGPAYRVVAAIAATTALLLALGAPVSAKKLFQIWIRRRHSIRSPSLQRAQTPLVRVERSTRMAERSLAHAGVAQPRVRAGPFHQSWCGSGMAAIDGGRSRLDRRSAQLSRTVNCLSRTSSPAGSTQPSPMSGTPSNAPMCNKALPPMAATSSTPGPGGSSS